jgi:hypothetical protein
MDGMLSQGRKASVLVRVLLGLLILPDITLLPWLSAHYQKICPTTPDEQAGIIYPLNQHGSIVYLTLAQHRKILAGDAYLAGSVLGFVVLGVWATGRPSAKKMSHQERRF